MNYNIATRKKKGFTLAEALIVLMIIGVIAALAIPAILVNTEQNEYKSALKKAVSMLNQVIQLNIALDGYGPLETTDMDNSPESLDNESLYRMFKNRMSVISTSMYEKGGTTNLAFFTADGMRYEFPESPNNFETGTINVFNEKNAHCARPLPPEEAAYDEFKIYDNAGNEQTKPCLIVVDVNGERKPNPQKKLAGAYQPYKVPKPAANARILDVFTIMITDKNAVPYGIVGQKAMFQHN